MVDNKEWLDYKYKRTDNYQPIIKNYNDSMYRLVVLKRNIDYNNMNRSRKGSVNDNKLENNLIRSKNMIMELGLCNDWEYFVTLTLDSGKYDRENLKQYIKELGKFIGNQGQKYNTKINYILVPELHKDGKSWHMHGLITGFTPEMLELTGHCNHETGEQYYTWSDYHNKFGYMSLSVIENKIGASLYIKKYLTKDIDNSPISMGLHTYYRSKGLNTASRVLLQNKALYEDFWKLLYSDDFCDLFDIDNENALKMINEYEMIIAKNLKT